MSNLPDTHLPQVRDAICARIDEFGTQVVHLHKPSLGETRIAFDVIYEWLRDREPDRVAQRIGDVTITAEMAIKLSKQGYEMGYAAAKAEMSPVREEAEDKRLAIMGVPEPMLQSIDDHDDILDWRNAIPAPTNLKAATMLVSDANGVNSTNVDDDDDPPPKSDEKLTWVELSGEGEPHLAGQGRESLAEAIADFADLPKDQVVKSLDDMGIGRELSPRAASEPAPEPIPPLIPRRLPPDPLDTVRDYSDPRPPHPDVARSRLAAALANGSGGALVQAITQPRTLEEVDADNISRDSVGRKHRYHLPDLAELIAEVTRQAMGNVMPLMGNFDRARPANWAMAQSHLTRLGLTWESLRVKAGLKSNPRTTTKQPN